MNSHFKFLVLFVAPWFMVGVCNGKPQLDAERIRADKACVEMAKEGLRLIAGQQTERFLGKVSAATAECRGGEKALAGRGTVWVDWANYWATGDESSKSIGWQSITKLGRHLNPNGRGVDGALMDLEYQRMELIRFNLYDNKTYETYIKGKDGMIGSVVKTWDEMKLPPSHPKYAEVTDPEGKQLCKGELIRFRNVTGICNDIYNPAMGSANQLFARNVSFDATFPRLGANELVRNRHGERLGLLKPDPQVISRKLFTRQQSNPAACNEGQGLANNAVNANCDYKKAPFFNVLAAYWIQFMTHDWFYHLREGQNTEERMPVGCATQLLNNKEEPISEQEAKKLGCRPKDRVDVALVADKEPAPTFQYDGKTYMKRAHRTTQNTVTAWWDASQIYGFDETSLQRVKRDPNDTARLLMLPRGNHEGTGEKQGYLPIFDGNDPINPAWKGQEATGFADNWTVGLSFYHNLFVREHNRFVDSFRAMAAKMPNADSGLRDPNNPSKVIAYKDVSNEELFQIARLVVAAEIAKIHTIEWTTQLLYGEPLYLGMNANWNGLVEKDNPVNKVLGKIVVNYLAKSSKEKKANQIYSVFASGAGITGLGSHRYKNGLLSGSKDIWDLRNPEHVNGGVNHFGSPFNFPEEFTTVYRLHPLLPDLLEFRDLKTPNTISQKVPVVSTFRGNATQAMTEGGLSSWALSLGRQRLGLLTLQNHAQFLQNLKLPRLQSETNQIDIAALDLIRDRERGIPRFNEFRRQYGLKQLTSFDDFIDWRLPKNSAEYKEQQRLVGLLREVYGQHVCDTGKVITDAQLNDDGTPINDCLGHADGSLIDNIEDVDTVVGWLSEFTRPHGFAISETQFHVFILNASRRLFSDRFFTSSFRPDFYSKLGVDWVTNNGPDGKQYEPEMSNGHKVEISPLKRIMLRTMPELKGELAGVVNVFDPWARDRGDYYTLQWKPRGAAIMDASFDE